MIKNPLQNIEVFETITLVGLGIFLLLTLGPVNQIRVLFAGILAGVLLILVGGSVWGGRHHQH